LTSPISGYSGTAATGATGATGGTTSGSGMSLDQNAFLKLLVAQMKYQDPSKPMDASQMMSQTATYTQVEKLAALVTAQQSMVSAQHLQAASSMVGRTVAYTLPDGSTGTGVVSSAKLTGSDPTLKVGNTDVPLSSVTEVRSSAG
jgi:flagellar basal-body rod modification protein FlgD